MLKSFAKIRFVRSARKRALAALNLRHCVRQIEPRVRGGRVPVFIIVTPQIVHLAAASAKTLPVGVNLFFVLNGVNKDDENWLRGIYPDSFYVALRTSLSGKSKNLVSHGEIIDILAQSCEGEFCLMDADNFVLNPELIEDLRLKSSDEFAVGPFVKGEDRYGAVIPETFMITINGRLFSHLRSRDGLTAEVCTRPSGKLRLALAQAGYGDLVFPEPENDFWDTLQMYWCLAQHNGYSYRHIEEGESKCVHIGGTSYLHNVGEGVDRWNYLPLSVHYINLRLLEFEWMARFRHRFRTLEEHYGSADAIVQRYPDFQRTTRYGDVNRIISTFFADTNFTLD